MLDARKDRIDQSPATGQGFDRPRLYDLMVLLLTRGRDRAYREELLDLVAVSTGDHVLDIGCGTGTLAISAWRRVRPAGSVTGTDISEPMLAAARRKARRAGCHIDFVSADAAFLPLADATYDVALMTTVMHMVPETARPRVIREMARVLKPGSRVLLVDFGGPLAERTGFSARHGRHGAFDLYDLRSDLADAGFGHVEAGPLGWLDLHFLRAERL